MTIVFNADTGVTTPGVTNSGSETVSGNSVVSGTLQVGGITTNLYPLVAGTAVASTSGTSIDFTGIPSWVDRVTVMFSGVSTSGTSNIQVQLGAGSVETTGYNSQAVQLIASTNAVASSTTGFVITGSNTAASTHSGLIIIALLGSNIWTETGGTINIGNALNTCSGAKTLSDVLDRVRVTTVNGTDTFDAGSINILWE